jgi:tight adherence protein C
MLMLLILAVACLAGAVFLVGEISTAPNRRRAASLGRAMAYGRSPTTAVAQPARRSQLADSLRDRMTGLALRLNSKTSIESVGRSLVSAGAARRISATDFLAAKAALGLAGVFGGGLIGMTTSGAGKGLFAAIIFGLFGFFAPDMALAPLRRTRTEEIRAKLPDALDLLAVSVEAGLGFDGAIAKLAERRDGPLAEEFALTLGEMRIGQSRTQALKNMAARVDIPEFVAFTQSIIQAEQLGSSLARILRVQAADARRRRQSAAEERAQKAPVKMIFPVAFFIFPAMFVIILGPAMLSIKELF